MRIVFIGPPGAGKGTQSTLLAQHLQVPRLSTGEIFRKAARQKSEVGSQVEDYLLKGLLVPDPLVEQIVFELLSQPECKQGYILDGFPRTVPQASNLDLWLQKQSQQLSAVLELKVSREALLERLAGRGRSDDDRQVVAERLNQYDQLTFPLLDYYREHDRLCVVDGLGTTDEVFARIQQIVDNLPG